MREAEKGSDKEGAGRDSHTDFTSKKSKYSAKYFSSY
jgi:hypothetical protein